MKRNVGIVFALLALLVAAAIWFIVSRSDAPPAPTLSDPTESSADNGSEDSNAQDEASPLEATVASLDGTWTVGEGSEGGYRVVEDLGNVLDFEAVGRSSSPTGTLEISGTTVQSGSFAIEIKSILSDDERRDQAFFTQLDWQTFPEATLELTAPIELVSIPTPGEQVSTEASGDLTLKGATNSVTFPVEAQLVGDRIELVGAIDVAFSDYGIGNPSNPFVEVRDEGKVEVEFFLDRQ